MRPSDAPAEVYNAFIVLGNKYGEMADALEVKDFVVTGPAVPEVVSGVTVKRWRVAFMR
jgi:hypothetical protein